MRHDGYEYYCAGQEGHRSVVEPGTGRDTLGDETSHALGPLTLAYSPNPRGPGWNLPRALEKSSLTTLH